MPLSDEMLRRCTPVEISPNLTAYAKAHLRLLEIQRNFRRVVRRPKDCFDDIYFDRRQAVEAGNKAIELCAQDQGTFAFHLRPVEISPFS